MKKPETKLIQCPYLEVKRKYRKQPLEDMLDEWAREAKKEKQMFSSKDKKLKRKNLRKRGN